MLNLKEKIFGETGFSSDMKLSSDELTLFRNLINEHWITVIRQNHPELAEEANKIGIEHYHLISNQLDHSKLWTKYNRVLPQDTVQQIKSMPFFLILKKEFGEFKISDVVHTKQEKGHEEIYWRLVRPSIETDVGPLHKDKWFHNAFNSGYGMFADGSITIKIWIPIYCEPGKSGLELLPGSHLKEYKYHIEVIDDVPKPRIDEDASMLETKLVLTEPGNLLIFNENLLHGGAINKSDKTRVSAEITMVFNNQI